MGDSKRFFKFYSRPGEDFDLWTARTEAALASQGILEVVTTDVISSATDAMPLSPEMASKASKAGAVIMQRLDAKPLRLWLAEKDNPHKMWQRLKDRYAVCNVATQVQLQMKLNRLRYLDQQMSDYVDQFDVIFNRLKGMAASFLETLQVAIILSSFGEK